MKRILIIEDDRDLSNLWQLAIERMGSPGLQAEAARDGLSALKTLGGNWNWLLPPPDLIILDLHLPRVDGQKIYDFIRQDKDLLNSRVVIITSDRHLADEFLEKSERGEIIPPDKIVVKPVLIRDFQSIVKKLLDEK